MCALFRNSTTVLDYYYYWCGASLINNQWLLTAAHCVYGSPATDFVVLCGNQNITQWNNNQFYNVSYLSVSQIVVYPNYRVSNDNDTALVQLSTPLSFGQYQQPVCLPSAQDTTCLTTCPNTTVGFIAGWGTRNLTIPPVIYGDPLLQNQISFISNTICGRDNTRICAGSVGDSVCFGDSGGPLVIKGTSGKTTLYGTISTILGDNCETAAYDVMVRVSSFRPWIESVLATTNGSNVYVTSLVPYPVCGQTSLSKSESKIVGGSAAPNGTWPSMCALFRNSTVILDYYYYWCGATLINNQWLLTTASCVRGFKTTDFVVLCGQQNISQWNNNHYYNASYLSVSNLVVYPNTQNDIALVKLSSPLIFNKYQQPICLVNATDTTCLNGCTNATTALIAGWGQLNKTTGATSILQQVLAPLVPNAACGVGNCSICAGTTNIGGCYGDAGGPLVIKDTTGISIQYGVLYAGPSNCTSGPPTKFTRVSCNLAWIQTTLQTY